MKYKVQTYSDDYARLKVHATANDEDLMSVQDRAVRRLLDVSPTQITRMDTATRGEPRARNWNTDPDTWDHFKQLRETTGLTTGQLLRAAILLEVLHG